MAILLSPPFRACPPGEECGTFPWSSAGRVKRGSMRIFARKKRIKPKDLSKQRDFEDGMMVWDDVFEQACEDSAKVARIISVAERGLAAHGRGCVLVRQLTASIKRGPGTGFVSRSRPLLKSSHPAFYKSFEWSVSYIPRNFILDPSLAPADQELKGTALAVSSVSSSVMQETDAVSSEEARPTAAQLQSLKPSSLKEELLVRQVDLMPVLRAIDRTRVLSLTTERVMRDSMSSRTVQNDEQQDAGGEEPYKPESGELVLLVSVEFDDRPIIGADVVQASQINNKWKLKLRESSMFL